MNIVPYYISRMIFRGGGSGWEYLARLGLIDPFLISEIDPMTLSEINAIGKSDGGDTYPEHPNTQICKAVLLGIFWDASSEQK